MSNGYVLESVSKFRYDAVRYELADLQKDYAALLDHLGLKFVDVPATASKRILVRVR